jgi:uncharacterized protein (DUF427 family)
MQGHQIELVDEPGRVEIIIDGVQVASSTNALTLLETGLPPRYYLPRADVHMEHLDATVTETVCPFKGSASYWTARIGDAEHRDIAWSYERPIDGMERIALRVCFYAERTDHVVDGVPVERPETPWSSAEP